MSFNLSTDSFRGPVDLLLFLVRRHEVEVAHIAVSEITEQYLEYLEILKEIDIDMVGDFIDVASLLIEMKARAVLPLNEFEQEENVEDPRKDLVERLLMYKQFKDASNRLDERATRWQNRFQRIVDDLPPRQIDMADQPIVEVELWDLVSSFGRVLRDNIPKPEANIVYDDTPIQVYMQRIHRRLVDEHRVSFTTMFEKGMHKSAMVGVFLAILELVRHHNVVAEQPDLHSEIWIIPNEGFDEKLELSGVDDYQPHKRQSGDPASMVE